MRELECGNPLDFFFQSDPYLSPGEPQKPEGRRAGPEGGVQTLEPGNTPPALASVNPAPCGPVTQNCASPTLAEHLYSRILAEGARAAVARPKNSLKWRVLLWLWLWRSAARP